MTDLEHQPVVRKTQPEKTSGFEAWQLRAARAAANLSIQKLAEISGVSVSSIQRAEKSGSDPMSRVNQKALLDALAAKGVEMSGLDVQPATVTMSETRTNAPTEVEQTDTVDVDKS